jgi:hypothetical protein
VTDRTLIYARGVRVISRLTDRGVEVFDADLELLRTFDVPDVDAYAVSSTRDAVVYAAGEAVVRIDADGRVRWRFEQAAADCAFSADDGRVWIYVRGDQWIELDAATGEPLTRTDLPTAGRGGRQFALPDGTMLLEVGEGPDALTIFRSGRHGLVTYPWHDRVLVALAPGCGQMMTVRHDQEDVVFHAFPDGEALVTLPVEAFGVDPATSVIEYGGGYLDEDTAIVVVYGDDGEPWWRHYRVDVHTGEVLGDLGIATIDEYDLQPLGDGSYVITDTDGTLRRM